MKLRYLAALVACLSLSAGIAGVTLWQGSFGEAECRAAALVVMVLAWAFDGVWRDVERNAHGPIYGRD